MRALVLSDTHGLLDAVLKILQAEKYDLILHAGDFFRDSRALAAVAEVPVYGVTGNCDPPAAGPGERILTLEGNKVLLAHGHQWQVKTSYQGVFYRARQDGVDAVVFGHTHVPLNETDAGILLFNPGSTSRPRPGNSPTYGILEINREGIKGYIHSV